MAWRRFFALLVALVIWSSAGSVLSAATNSPTDVTIAFLLPLSGGSASSSEHYRVAAILAEDSVNANPFLLPNSTFHVKFIDDQGTASRGFFAALEACQDYRLPLILGPLSTAVVKSAAVVAAQFSVPIISPSASSIVLSNKVAYPTFSRLCPSDSFQALAVIELCKHYSWTRVATINAEDAYAQPFVDAFAHYAASSAIEVVSAAVFAGGSDLPTTVAAATAALLAIKAHDARIILAVGYAADMLPMFTAADALGMLGAPYLYIVSDSLMGQALAAWPPALLAKMDGVIGTKPHSATDTPAYNRFVIDWSASKAGDARFPANFDTTRPPSSYDSLTYDSVHLAAMAIHTHLHTNGRFLNDTTGLIATVRSTTSILDYAPVSGDIELDANGDREGSYDVVSLQKKTAQQVIVGFIGEGRVELSSTIVWPSGKTVPPRDRPEHVDVVVVPAEGLYLAILVLTCISIAIALFFLVINVAHRNCRLIRLSSARANAVLIIGCLIGFAFLIISGLPIHLHPWTCQTRTWFLSVSFTVVVGLLFAKTFRVHRIINAKTLKVPVIGDVWLLGVVGVLLCIDLVILITWTAYDPLQPRATLIASLVSEGNVDLTEDLFTFSCSADTEFSFYGVTLAWKGMLLVWGSWLAFEARSAYVLDICDSNLIAWCLYTAGIVSAAVVLITFLVTDAGAVYMVTAVGVLLVLDATLFIVFIPKVYRIIQGTANEDLARPPATIAANRQSSPVCPHGATCPVCSRSGKLSDIESTTQLIREGAALPRSPRGDPKDDRIADLEKEVKELHLALGLIALRSGPKAQEKGNTSSVYSHA